MNFISEMKKANKRASDIQIKSSIRLPGHRDRKNMEALDATGSSDMEALDATGATDPLNMEALDATEIIQAFEIK